MLDVGLELNVLFDDPFWIGVFYLTNGDKCYVERVVFGQEPSDGEIYVYFLNNYLMLMSQKFLLLFFYHFLLNHGFFHIIAILQCFQDNAQQEDFFLLG